MRERFFSLCILLCLLDLPIQKLILKLKKKKNTKQSSRGQIQSENLLQASLVAH